MPTEILPSNPLLTGDTLTPVTTSAGMLFACWAIVIVLLAMFIVFMRARQKSYALAILPLVIVPFIHIISGVIKNYMTRKFLGSDEPISPMQKVILLRNGLTAPVIDLLENAPLEGGHSHG